MPARTAYDEVAQVPQAAIRFPVELRPPDGFDADRLETWPKVEGRLEFVEGRILYMPPCGDEQADTAADATGILWTWARSHPGFVVGSNEAGMKLGGAVRAADAAIWSEVGLGRRTGRVRRVPPILAVEVTGQDESLDILTEKARWYLDRGVEVVWVLHPSSRTARVVTSTSTRDIGPGGTMPAHPTLPGLAPALEDLFRQVSR